MSRWLHLISRYDRPPHATSFAAERYAALISEGDEFAALQLLAPSVVLAE